MNVFEKMFSKEIYRWDTTRCSALPWYFKSKAAPSGTRPSFETRAAKKGIFLGHEEAEMPSL